jgi:hypothetical protein
MDRNNTLTYLGNIIFDLKSFKRGRLDFFKAWLRAKNAETIRPEKKERQ